MKNELFMLCEETMPTEEELCRLIFVRKSKFIARSPIAVFTSDKSRLYDAIKEEVNRSHKRKRPS